MPELAVIYSQLGFIFQSPSPDKFMKPEAHEHDLVNTIKILNISIQLKDKNIFSKTYRYSSKVKDMTHDDILCYRVRGR